MMRLMSPRCWRSQSKCRDDFRRLERERQSLLADDLSQSIHLRGGKLIGHERIELLSQFSHFGVLRGQAPDKLVRQRPTLLVKRFDRQFDRCGVLLIDAKLALHPLVGQGPQRGNAIQHPQFFHHLLNARRCRFQFFGERWIVRTIAQEILIELQRRFQKAAT